MDNPISFSTVGCQLRTKREEQQLTLDDVASHLRLKKDLIDDIEKGRYTKIPLTYLKGYLRSYAKLLAFSEEEALMALDFPEKDESIKSWKIFSSRKQVSSGDKLIQWITFSIIFVLILLVTLWWKSDNLMYKNLSVSESFPENMSYQLAHNTAAQ